VLPRCPLLLQCVSDLGSGFTPERSAKLRGKFTPRFEVESFCEPRWCNKTSYVDEGWCVFDNNFSLKVSNAVMLCSIYFQYCILCLYKGLYSSVLLTDIYKLGHVHVSPV